MADDLKERVPTKGLADIDLGKPEIQLRHQKKRQQEDDTDPWGTLGELWKKGEMARKTARDRETGNEVGAGDGVREFALLSQDHAKMGYRQCHK